MNNDIKESSEIDEWIDYQADKFDLYKKSLGIEEEFTSTYQLFTLKQCVEAVNFWSMIRIPEELVLKHLKGEIK